MSTRGHSLVQCRSIAHQLLLEAENEPKAGRLMAPTSGRRNGRDIRSRTARICFFNRTDLLQYRFFTMQITKNQLPYGSGLLLLPYGNASVSSSWLCRRVHYAYALGGRCELAMFLHSKHSYILTLLRTSQLETK